MSAQRLIDLSGGWQLAWTEFAGDAAEPPAGGPAPVLDATVPGCVHQDLLREGLIPDPFVGTNTDAALWVEHKDWWYRRRFATPAGAAGSPARLVFHGLDTFATVWLNGHRLGRTDNMFRRYAFDVGDRLRAGGDNELVVRLAAPAYSIRLDPDHAPLIWSPERLFVRKAQMSFGWDIAPRLVTVGIWRPVELVLIDTACIAGVRITHGDPTAERVPVRIETEIEWLADAPGPVRLSGGVGDRTWEAAGECPPGVGTLSAEVVLDEPPLWWPIGYGEPNLLDVEVRLQSGGRELDARRLRIGLRTIELVQEPQPSGARSFGFRCNGRDVFVTGFNWTPLDAIFPRISPQKITATLERVASVGGNMLRIWGGGIYEPPHFYDECDRLGILVWQDFMMACGWYPQTDDFAAALADEARQVVTDLRHHPCIALWCGDNENDWFARGRHEQNRLTRRVLPEICRRLDPDRPYLPSSPCSPSDPDPNCQTEGDMHWYGHGQDYRASEGWGFRCRFMSEFGHLSLPSLEVIEGYFPPGTSWPLTSPMWRWHGADTFRIPRFRGTDRVLASLAACGKGQPATIEQAVEASQDLQAEAVCALIERWAEDPEFAGVLVWNVADCWPQMSDAVIDYLGNAKRILDRLGPLFARLRQQRAAGTQETPR